MNFIIYTHSVFAPKSSWTFSALQETQLHVVINNLIHSFYCCFCSIFIRKRLPPLVLGIDFSLSCHDPPLYWNKIYISSEDESEILLMCDVRCVMVCPAENVFCFINGSCIQGQQHMTSSPPQYKMVYHNLRIGSLHNFTFHLRAVFSPLSALTSSIFDTSVFQILLPKKV